MTRKVTFVALCLAVTVGLLGTPGANQEAEAFVVLPVPIFPPIADCGTVGFVPSIFEGEECKVWFADSGGAYIVAGLDPYEEGDRIFVDGLNCTTCLTTCYAGAILNATLSECDACGGKGAPCSSDDDCCSGNCRPNGHCK